MGFYDDWADPNAFFTTPELHPRIKRKVKSCSKKKIPVDHCRCPKCGHRSLWPVKENHTCSKKQQ